MRVRAPLPHPRCLLSRPSCPLHAGAWVAILTVMVTEIKAAVVPVPVVVGVVSDRIVPAAVFC